LTARHQRRFEDANSSDGRGRRGLGFVLLWRKQPLAGQSKIAAMDMKLISPKFRAGLSLGLWPFLVMSATFASDAPITGFWDDLFRTSFAISMLFYPVFILYGAVLSRSKNETRKEKARFWLATPWWLIGFWIVAWITVGTVKKLTGA
jgi:hypothetical protein